MTTTLQQMLAEPKPLLDLARRGEEVVLTEGGKPVVRLTGIATGSRKAPPGAIAAWIKEARDLAAASATGKRGETVDEIIDDLRSERS
jgi:antitoxin (DNA-binding transcriptional repressor) of toxin-antitoxin stability system